LLVHHTQPENIAMEWHEQQRGRWTDGHAAQVLSTMKAYLFPDIGALAIGDITAPTVLAALRKIEKRGHLGSRLENHATL